MNEKSLVSTVFIYIYGWFVQNGYRPFISIVDQSVDGLAIPEGYSVDGILTISVAPSAVMNFIVTETGLEFQSRFNGNPHRLSVPWQSFYLHSPDYHSAPIPMSAFIGTPAVSTVSKPATETAVVRKPTLTVVK